MKYPVEYILGNELRAKLILRGGRHCARHILVSLRKLQDLRLPLVRGSRVLITSSGAAIGGSPLSGGYAGAKRMLWLMASYANVASDERGTGIKFQAIVPQQMVGDTELGRAGAAAYAKRKGISARPTSRASERRCPPRRSACMWSRS